MQKGGKNMKKAAFIAVLSALSAFAVGGVGCKDDETGTLVYELPAQTEIGVGESFTPDFKLGDDTTAELVSLKTPATSLTKADGMAFTPDATGRYEYTVTFSSGDESATETIVFTAADRTAPVIGALSDKETELGFYKALQADLDEIAENVTDNCATDVNVYPKSLVFNGVETAVDKDATELFFSRVGEYTVNIVAEDYSGNKAEGSYKITAKDTVKPVIEAPQAFISWVVDGKVRLPEVNVIDLASDTLVVTATDENENSVSVEDGYLTTTATGAYTLTYTATDTSGNSAVAIVKLFVKEKGVIADFGGEDDASVFGGADSWYESNGLSVMTGENETSVSYDEYFVIDDWSGYEKLTIDVENKRPADLTVQAELKIDGEWRSVAPLTVDAATVDGVDLVGVTPTSVQYAIYLADHSVTSVEGIRLRLTCDGGVSAKIDNIRLVDEDDRTLPAEGDLSGFGAGEYTLAAGGVVSLTGTQLSAANAVKLNVYSTANANVRIVLKYGNETVSARRALSEGDNEIIRLIDVEKGAGVITTGLTAVEIYNEEDFAVTLFVDGVTAENVTSIPVASYVKTDKTYGVTYGESFTVPYPFLVSSKYYSGLRICLFDQYDENQGEVSVGQLLTSSGDSGLVLAAGAYKLEYAFEDAFGVEQSVVYAFNVEKKVLAVELDMPALFLDGVDENGITLPEPILSSDVYAEAELADAVIEKYYRESGRATWNKISATTKFLPVNSGLYELRYVVTLDGLRKEYKFEKYVHESANIVDFEQESDVGMDCVKKDTRSGYYEVLPSRFLFDGGYFNYFSTNASLNFELYSGWSASGNYSLTINPTSRGWYGFLLKNMTGKQTINAVTFTLKTDSGNAKQQVWLGVDSGGIYSNAFESKEGEGTYTVLLEKEVALCDIRSFTINSSGYVRMSIDDVEFTYVKRLEMSGLSYESVLDSTTPYTVAKPTISTNYYTQEEMAAAAYVLKYSVNGGAGKEVLPDAQGAYTVTLPTSGEVTFEWTVTMADGYVVTRSISIDVGVQLEADVPSSGTVGEAIALSAPTSEYTLSDVKVEYRCGEEGEWTVLESPYTLTPTAGNTGRYFVRYTAMADVDGKATACELIKEIYVRDENSAMIDFEAVEGENYNLGQSDKLFDKPLGSSTGMMTDAYAHSGRYSLGVYTKGWIGFKNLSIDIPEKAYGIVEFWAYSENDLSTKARFDVGYENVNGGETWIHTGYVIDIKAGWNVYRIPLMSDSAPGLPPTATFSKIKAFTFNPGSNAKVYVDDITFMTAEFDGEFPKDIAMNDEKAIPACTLDGETNTAVMYRVKGDTDWTTVANGKVKFTSAGEYELKYAFADGVEIVYTLTVTAPATSALDAAMPKAAMLDTEITLPTGTYEDITATIEYRVKGTTTWTAVTDGKFTATECSVYEVRYAFGESFTKTYEVEINAPEVDIAMPTDKVIGDTFTPPTATYKDQTATVTYRLKGEETWLELPESGEVELLAAATYEWQFSFNKFAVVKELAVSYPAYELSADWVNSVKQGEELTLPTATYNGETATAYYRRAGVNAWTVVKEGKVTFSYIAKYEVRYVFEDFEVIKTIRVVDPNVFMDFEGDDPLQGGKQYSTAATVEVKTDEDGNGYLSVSNVTIESWTGIEGLSIDLGSVTKLKVTLTSDRTYTYAGGMFDIKGDAGWLRAKNVTTLEAGTHEYILTFDQAIGTMTAFTIKCHWAGYDELRIDDIAIVTE